MYYYQQSRPGTVPLWAVLACLVRGAPDYRRRSLPRYIPLLRGRRLVRPLRPRFARPPPLSGEARRGYFCLTPRKARSALKSFPRLDITQKPHRKRHPSLSMRLFKPYSVPSLSICPPLSQHGERQGPVIVNEVAIREQIREPVPQVHHITGLTIQHFVHILSNSISLLCYNTVKGRVQ